MLLLTTEERTTLIAHADDVATSFVERWGRAAIGDPKFTDERGWHIEVVGLIDDIQMATVVVYPTGSREMAV